MSPSPTVPDAPASPPPPDPAADATAAGPGKDEPEQRTSIVLVTLLLAANLLFVLLIGPVHGLAALNQDVSKFNGDQVDGGWFLLFPCPCT